MFRGWGILSRYIRKIICALQFKRYYKFNLWTVNTHTDFIMGLFIIIYFYNSNIFKNNFDILRGLWILFNFNYKILWLNLCHFKLFLIYEIKLKNILLLWSKLRNKLLVSSTIWRSKGVFGKQTVIFSFFGNLKYCGN